MSNEIGKSIQRIEGMSKVLGSAKYSADLKMNNMVYVKVFRSKIPHGILKKINIKKVKLLEGVVCILTREDIVGTNTYGIMIKDEPVLIGIGDKIRKIGDPIVIVACETEEIAKEAIKLIDVDIQELEGVFDPVYAMSEKAPKIYEKGNLLATRKIVKGDSKMAFEKCSHIVENEYKTQMVEHAYIEPESGIATFENGNITIWCSTQNPTYDRKDVAKNLNLGYHQVRVIQAVTGGGFGGKLDISVQIYIAIVAKYTKRPAKMTYSRWESIVCSPKRHPMIIKMKTGIDDNGKILAMECEIVGDTGAYSSYGPGVLTRTAVMSTGPYEIDNLNVTAHTVYTNNPQSGAMRGFGVPQIVFATESQLDILAEKACITPFEIRKINALKVGSKTSTGQILRQSVGILETIEKSEKKAIELSINSPTDIGLSSFSKKNGVGVGCMIYGIGNTGLPNPAGAFVDIYDDATISVLTGCSDIGQGSDTTMAQIAASEFGVSTKDVTVISADSGVTPEGGASSASRQTYISGNAVKLAVAQAKKELSSEASMALDTTEDNLIFENYKISKKDDLKKSIDLKDCIVICRKKGKLTQGSAYFNPDTTSLDATTGQGSPYATYAYATQVAQVEVDIETGKVTVKNIVAAHDVGCAINPQSVEGQIEGGISIGLGFALFEKIEVRDGLIVTPNFATYILPTASDIPKIYPIIVEDYENSGPFGAKGVGEPTLIPTAAAISNAIYNAIGVRIYSLPITPEKILKALEELNNVK